eukprot:COSAG02_NODE_43610_length_373_cov_0.755474_1_plen_107_part_10
MCVGWIKVEDNCLDFSKWCIFCASNVSSDYGCSTLVGLASGAKEAWGWRRDRAFGCRARARAVPGRRVFMSHFVRIPWRISCMAHSMAHSSSTDVTWALLTVLIKTC